MIDAGHVFRFPATSAGLDATVRSLRTLLDGRSLTPEHRHDVELVFEELASNIVNHGGPKGDVEMVIRFDGATTLTLEDDGVPFDLREHPSPPIPARREDLKIGGLGIVLVRSICTRIDYARTPEGRNRLTVVVPAER